MTVLADTNIWVGFFREGNAVLEDLLESGFLSIHQLVIGELAMGCLPERRRTLRDFGALPKTRRASWLEAFTLLEENELWGKGLQWNDLEILASVILSPGTLLWTRDRRLAEAAARMKVSFAPEGG